MCDTQIILHGGSVWFAKNSDREPSEAQPVCRVPAVSGDSAARLRATHIEIDQVPDRHATILSQPFWIWGAEMGINDRGVAIGNEAIFSKATEKAPGLIGMDLLRLGLERGSSAREALEVIADLLRKHGQGGVCGFRDKKFRYDNAFLIADPSEAWVLETAGRHWAAKKIESRWAISNALSIGSDYDLHSEGMEDFAKDRGWFSGAGDFHFARAFDTSFFPYFAGSHKRKALSDRCLTDLSGESEIGLGSLAANLRAHQSQDANPRHGSNRDVCMHAGGPLIRRSQTTGSMIARLDGGRNPALFTGTSAPCLSLFKPVDFDPSIEWSALHPPEESMDRSLWSRFERVHRRLLLQPERLEGFRAQRDRVEAGILEAASQPDGSSEALKRADESALAWHREAEERLIEEAVRYPLLDLYAQYWKRLNRLDRLD